jgi:hypothetical protein
MGINTGWGGGGGGAVADGSITEAKLADAAVTSAKLGSSLSLTTPNIGVATATSVNGTTIPTSKTLLETTSSIAASQIGSGTIATARLGSGTANSSSYLRGDQTWASVSAGFTATSTWYTGVAARGSTNTYVVRWSTNSQTVGSGITYSSSAANGDSFTIVETGTYLILTGFYATTGFEALLHIGDSIVNTIAFDAATAVDVRLINTNNYYNGPQYLGQIAAGKKVWVTTGQAPLNTYPLMNRIQIARIS